MVDITKEPYNDRFNPDNEYQKLLFNPDRPLQSSELTELQSILEHQSARIAGTLLVDGDIQDGMDFIISEDESEITIMDGEVFLDGKIRTFNEQTIPFSKSDKFEVCVGLNQEIVTSEEDENLLDQTSGVESYYSSGADRLKETVFLTSDPEEGVPILEFRGGDLFLNNPGNRELTRLNEILARRTYDESGSYKVRGLGIRGEENQTNQNQIDVVIEAGKAYVLGYEIDKPTATRIPVSKALDKATVQSEAFYYDNRTRRGKLGNSPVEENGVNRVTAQVQVTRESVGRGATADSSDTLANSSVTNVVKVWGESNGEEIATYLQGTDFQLRNGREIDWSPSGNEPSAGSTYYVTYTYNKTLVKGTDYKVVAEGSPDNRETYIDFNGLTGNKPVPNSMVLVDYEYYLAREDLVMLDRDGEIHIQTGQPDSLERVKKPDSSDPYMLALGSIVIYPNSTTTIPHQSTITRLSMVDLQNMKNRIDNLEYNQAINALDQPTMEDVNPAVLRGVFSDGFISMSKYDSGHPDARIGFSFEDGQITLPYDSAKKLKPTMIEGSSNAHTWGRLVTAPFTEELAITQPKATEQFNINPYNVFNNRAMMKLTPSEDNWVDEERVVVVEEQDAGILNVRQWWRHPTAHWVDDEREKASNIQLDNGIEWEDVDSSKYGTRLPGGGWRWSTDLTTSQMLSGGTRTQESIIDFMRQIDIQFEVTSLTPNTNNLVMYFDGNRVPITPASGFTQGTETGTIRSNAQGDAKGTFRIPEGVRTGTREVIIENADNVAVATFVAQGQKKRVEDVIIRKYQTIQLNDPLAQSFQFRENRVVTSFEIFFASKDTTRNVGVQVRGITPGGQPDKTVYAQTRLTPSQVKVSSDASVPTKITFDDPLMVDAGQEYALVLLTDSDKYTVHVATRGQADINTGARITTNPYLTGVLYSSSNASAWTIHQDSDMKFNVYTANFNETAVLEFDTMKDVSADAVVLMATYLTPENTGCVWDVKMVMDNENQGIDVGSKQWLPLANYEEIPLNQIAREVKLRATFKANRFMSPIMSLNDLLLTSFLSALSGSYVGRTVDTSDAPWNTLRVSYESFEPGQSKITPRFSTDGGTTWRDFSSQPSTDSVSNEFTRYTYEEKVTESSNGYDSFKIRLDMSTPNSFVRPRAQRLMTNFNYE